MERISENIAVLYDHLYGKVNRKAILSHYRKLDESHLYPIHGRFNTTEKAIRRLYKFEREGGYYLSGIELCYFLEHQISEIVNKMIS